MSSNRFLKRKELIYHLFSVSSVSNPVLLISKERVIFWTKGNHIDSGTRVSLTKSRHFPLTSTIHLDDFLCWINFYRILFK